MVYFIERFAVPSPVFFFPPDQEKKFADREQKAFPTPSSASEVLFEKIISDK